MTWYCWKAGTHLIHTSINAFTIRGVPENMIFTVEAETRSEAVEIADKVIQDAKTKYWLTQRPYYNEQTEEQKSYCKQRLAPRGKNKPKNP